ncbi:hypothetical protein TNCV_1343511 [Trichonephila clavipes]|nr:hypothetical protein TNCV_1343511 [Trichonephila clavipes]
MTYFEALEPLYKNTPNQGAPLAVRTWEDFSPGHGDGTPPGTEAIQLRQRITALPLATREGSKHITSYFPTHTHHATNRCYPIGRAVYPPETLIGRGNFK